MPPEISAPERIVDADGHVLEHPSAMQEYMPAKYRDQGFYVTPSHEAASQEVLHFRGRTMNANLLALAGTGGLSLEDRERAGRGELKYTEVKPGAFDPKARLVEMSADAIQQAVVSKSNPATPCCSICRRRTATAHSPSAPPARCRTTFR